MTDVSEPLTISMLGRRTGVPTSAIRYYERVGLLRPTGRTEGNYRVYDAHAIERLGFVRAAQTSGFTLSDIKALLEFRDGVMSPCPEVHELIEHRMSEVETRLRELRHVRRVLDAFRAACEHATATDPCPVIDKLSGVPKTPS